MQYSFMNENKERRIPQIGYCAVLYILECERSDFTVNLFTTQAS